MPVRQCKRCGVQYEGQGLVFCTRVCADAVRVAAGIERRTKKCVGCGVSYLSQRGAAGRAQKHCASFKCRGAGTGKTRAENRRGFPPPTKIEGAVWIELGGGEFTLVDEADAPTLSAFIWHKAGKGYVSTSIGRQQVKMHRMLVPGALEVDHKNKDKRDNRRSNLREATHSQNCANIGVPKHNTSGFKGVSRFKSKWRAVIAENKKKIHIGLYATREEAAAAYDAKAKELFGEFAATNATLAEGVH